ncbi:MAG: hypothetical protein HUU55_23495, partial [Myxococcales bacterium]|nr:hypothetical protein [Myxococcales bacterium]
CSSTGNTSYTCVNALDAGNCLIGGVCYADNDENPLAECQICDSGTDPADWTNKADNTSCDADNTVCTVDDTCQSGSCVAGVSLVCDDSNGCTDDTCDPINGCEYSPNTVSCDDNDACTTTDTCAGGVCVSGPPLNCDDNNDCTDDSCDPSTGCEYSNNTGPCDDANACTTVDSCDAGVCISGPLLDCDDGNVCTDDTCNPASGCVYANNTSLCDDEDVCTTIDVCIAGTCTGTTPLNCDDSNVCTDDGCDPIGGCIYADNILPCDDSDLCTLNDVCVGGSCTGTPVTCPDTGNICLTDVCNPLFGTCGVPVDNGTSCDDGDDCTFADICTFGTCVGTPDPTCIVTGGGTLCGMAGIAGSTVICDIRLARSASAEPNATGLQFTLTYPKDIVTLESFVDEACFPGFGCFDYDVPAGSPLLASGHTATLSPLDPAAWDGQGDLILLHLSSPTPLNDAYQNNGPFSPIVNDPVVLSARFTVQQTITALTPAEVISSNIVATEETATPLSSYVEDGTIITTSYKVACAPNGSICDDGTTCTGLGICSVGVCVTGNVPNGTLCDDGDTCTTNDNCINGVCVGISDCNDNNPCTADICLGGGTCDYVELAGSCNDGNPCTINDVCTAGVCVGDETSCPATTNPCVVAECNTLTGLCGVPLVDGTSCDDADPCTLDDECNNGLCSGTPDPSCIPTGSGTICEVSGIPGAIVTCHIRIARSALTEAEATGIQFQLTYPSPTLTLMTFMDEACIPGFGCIQYMIPAGSNDLWSGHTVILAPLDLNDWSGGGSLVALNFANPSPLTDAWATGGPGTSINGEAISFSYQFLVNQFVDPGNPIEIYASGISATDAQAKPLRIQVYNNVLLTSSYTSPCAPNGTLCDDGNPCTAFGICAQGVCAAADLPEGTACDDGDACTDNDQCSFGICAGTPIGGCP